MNITELDCDENETEDEVDSLELDEGYISAGTAELVAGWLIAKYRSKLIYSCIDDVFGEMPDDEREAVYRSVCDIISGRYDLKHLEYIKQKIIEFFERDKRMNIDGFINFRLKAYKDELKVLVEECGYDVLGEKEYKEYLELLDLINFVFNSEY